MYYLRCCNDIITGLFNWLSSLSWPIFIFIIVWLFRHQIAWLIVHLKSASGLGWHFKFGEDDQVRLYSPEDKAIHEFVLQPAKPPSKKVPEAETKVQKLSDKQIEESKQKALERLVEDTKRVGYKRGKLYQLKSGKWAIAWDLEISDGIIIKDS